MLYNAIFVPPDEEQPPFDILDEPSLLKYHENWGRQGDIAIVLKHKRAGLVGICCARLHSIDNPGYGFVDESTPEITIAIKPEYRGKGYGSKLILKFISVARDEGYERISLSVVEMRL